MAVLPRSRLRKRGEAMLHRDKTQIADRPAIWPICNLQSAIGNGESSASQAERIEELRDVRVRNRRARAGRNREDLIARDVSPGSQASDPRNIEEPLAAGIRAEGDLLLFLDRAFAAEGTDDLIARRVKQGV